MLQKNRKITSRNSGDETNSSLKSKHFQTLTGSVLKEQLARESSKLKIHIPSGTGKVYTFGHQTTFKSSIGSKFIPTGESGEKSNLSKVPTFQSNSPDKFNRATLKVK
jgi:hypothetical protein